MKLIKIFLIIIFIQNILNAKLKNFKKVLFQGNPIAENCVACKFIWENVEESLGGSKENFNSDNERNPILASQAFQYFCRISPDIFYEPCNKMFEKLFFFVDDFVKNISIDQMCKKNEMCS